MNARERLIAALVAEYDLPPGSLERIGTLVERCVSLEISGTAVRDPDDALRLHVADSLSGLRVPAIRAAGTIADIGSGVGFPGIVLALARPRTKVTLLDAVRKKVEAAAALCRESALDNVKCVWARAEDHAALGAPARESYDVVTARALASLPVLLEYAAPLLTVGGSLVAWKGELDDAESAAAATAGRELGFGPGETIEVTPFAGSLRRRLFVAAKIRPVDERFPRRPGVAEKRPLGASD